MFNARYLRGQVVRKLAALMSVGAILAFSGMSFARLVAKPITSIKALQSAPDGIYIVRASLSGSNVDKELGSSWGTAVYTDGTGAIVVDHEPMQDALSAMAEDDKEAVRQARQARRERIAQRDTSGNVVGYMEVAKTNSFYTLRRFSPIYVKGSWAQETIVTTEGYTGLTKQQMKDRRYNDNLDRWFSWW
jgi:hypothetical protein